MTSSHKAIIRLRAEGKNTLRVNYARRMYAIMRRYTPDVAEGGMNECFADITGLRTFFKMSYKEITECIVKDIYTEIGIECLVKAATEEELLEVKAISQRHKGISTYKEINKLFKGASYVPKELRKKVTTKRTVRLSVPFLGKVA